MATESKFSTVLPNNTLKGAVNVTPISNVYQERTNTTGPMENEFDANDVVMSFNTKDFGSTATIMMPPSYKLLKDVYAVFDVTMSSGSPAAHPEDFVAYKIIDTFYYRIPGCERMVLDGSWLPYFWLDGCDNTAKRLRLLSLAGKKTDNTASTTYRFIAKLPLPCSSAYAQPEKKSKPMTLHLQGEPTELMIKIRPKTECLSANCTLDLAQIYFTYSHLGAFAEYKNTTYKYMFDANYDYSYVVPAGTAADKRNVTLTGIRSGETPQIKFRVIERNASNTKLYTGLKLSDIELRYAGQRIWVAEGQMQEAYQLDYNHDVNYFASSYAGLDDESSRSYWYHIPIGNVLNHEKNHGYVLGADFNNSELKLTFKMGVTTDNSTVHYLEVQQSVTSIYQYNGERASLIQ